MGFRGGGAELPPPPSISWFSSTPDEIGLKFTFVAGAWACSPSDPLVPLVPLVPLLPLAPLAPFG